MTHTDVRGAEVLRRAQEQFGPFDGRVWIDTAHQGPLPRVARDAARRAVAEKAAPYRIADEAFTAVPEHLRRSLAELIGGRPEEVVLGNSASYGMHLVAGAFPWREGDEVLLVDGDYPATVLPWLRLAERGRVRVRWLRPAGARPLPDEVCHALTPRTRAFAFSWVNSFTGHAVDLEAIGALCRAREVLSVVNATHGIGVRPLDVSRTPVDALTSCGYKWLCGPYGTGFCWLHPDLLPSLVPTQAYWLSMMGSRPLDTMRTHELRDDLGCRAHDVFCTANFLNHLPWHASVELMREVGVAPVADHVQRLVTRLVDGLDRAGHTLVSPVHGPARSSLVVVTPRRPGPDAAALHRRLTRTGVHAALREGNLRFSPHLFNSPADVDHVLEALRAGGTGG